MSVDATMSSSDHGSLERADEIMRRRFGLIIHEHQRAGFEHALDTVAGGLGFADRHRYLDALHDADDASPEVERLINEVTVGESYFFRDAAQVEFLQHRWIPDLIARRGGGDRRVRVWSAGCSHGQEIYTVAMLLDRYLPEPERWNIDLVGTDINPVALAVAAAGRYRPWSLRATPPWARIRYFEAHDTQWRLCARMLSRARFSHLNLADQHAVPTGDVARRFDLILCRNVFIYFDRDVVSSVLNRFAAGLESDGALLLGPADIVSEDTSAFEVQKFGRAHIFRPRRAPASARDPLDPAPASEVNAPVPAPPPRPRASVPAPPPATSAPLPAPPPVVRARVSNPRSEASAPVPDPPRAPSPDATCHRPAGLDGGLRAPGIAPVGVETIDDNLRDRAWEAAVTAADAWMAAHGESAHVLERKARACASLGRLDGALAASDRALALDPICRDAHFVRGLTLIERADLGAAEASLRKAIFLDRDFLEAHHQLGMLLIRQGRRGAGVRSLCNALASYERRPPTPESLRFAMCDDTEDLPAILRDEVSRHRCAATAQST